MNSVVDAVKDVGESVRKFNGSIQNVTTSVNHQLEENKDKIVNVIQWGQVIFELKDKWQERKQRKYVDSEGGIIMGNHERSYESDKRDDEIHAKDFIIGALTGAIVGSLDSLISCAKVGKRTSS